MMTVMVPWPLWTNSATGKEGGEGGRGEKEGKVELGNAWERAEKREDGGGGSREEGREKARGDGQGKRRKKDECKGEVRVEETRGEGISPTHQPLADSMYMKPGSSAIIAGRAVAKVIMSTLMWARWSNMPPRRE